MSTTVVILIIILLILALIITPFMRDLVKDKHELYSNPINKKFEEVATVINGIMLGGKGELTLFDDTPRLMNMMSPNMRNILIQFYYSTGHLKITLNYKFWQKELVYSKTYYNVRNITLNQQQAIGKDFSLICSEKMEEHQKAVLKESSQHYGTETNQEIPGDPIGLIDTLFSNLSKNQRLSAANFEYLIAKASGCDDSNILNSVPFQQFLVDIRVHWTDCKKYFETFGENRTYDDLKGIEESVVPILVLTALSIISQFRQSDKSVQTNVENKFYDSFSRIGYSQNQVDNMISKTEALAKMFGL